jgi:hypothetical protein
MRRILPLFVLALLLALPSLAGAYTRKPKPPPPGPGTLEISGGRGVILLKIRGSAIGFVQRGRVIVTQRGSEGDEQTYNGKNIKFRAVDGAYRIMIRGIGIDLSASGRGQVTLVGQKRGDSGEFSLNGEDSQPLPRRATTLQISSR